MLPRKKKSYRRKREENKRRWAIRREQETPEEREKRLETARLRAAAERALETDEQRQERLLYERIESRKCQRRKAQKREKERREMQRECEQKNAVVITLASLIDQVVKETEENKKKSLYEYFLISQTRQDCRQSRQCFLKWLNGFSSCYVSQSKENAQRSAIKRSLETPEEREKILQIERLRRAAKRALETDEQRHKRLLDARRRRQSKREQKQKKASLDYSKENKTIGATKAVRQAAETCKAQQQNRTLKAFMMQQHNRVQERENVFSNYLKKVKTKREELQAEQEVHREHEEKNAVPITLASLIDQVVKQEEEERRMIKHLRTAVSQALKTGKMLQQKRTLKACMMQQHNRVQERGNTFSGYLKKVQTKQEQFGEEHVVQHSDAVLITLASLINQVVKQEEEEKRKNIYRKKLKEITRKRAIKLALETPEQREKRLQSERLRRAAKRALETDEQRHKRLLDECRRRQSKREQKQKKASLEYSNEIKTKGAIKAVGQASETCKAQQQKRTLKTCMMQQHNRVQERENVFSDYLKKVKTEQQELGAEQEVQHSDGVLITLASLINQVVKQEEEEKKKYIYRKKLKEKTQKRAMKLALETPEQREIRLQTQRLRRAAKRTLETDEQRQKRLLDQCKRQQCRQSQKQKKASLEYSKEIKTKGAIKPVRQASETCKAQQQKRTLKTCMMQQHKQDPKQENTFSDFLINETRQDCRRSPRLFLRRLNGVSPNYSHKYGEVLWKRKNEISDYLKKLKTKQEELQAEREVQREHEEKKAVLITLASIMDQVVKQAEGEKKKSLYGDFLINQTRQDCRQSPRLLLQRLNGFSPNYYVSQCMSDSTRFKVLRSLAIKRSMLTSEEKEERNKMACLKYAEARLKYAEAQATWTDEQRTFYNERQRAYKNRIRRRKQNKKYTERSRRLAIKLAEIRNQDIKQEKINETRRQVSKLSLQLSLQSKNGFSSNYTSQADFGASAYMQYWYPENSTNILTDDVDVKYPELFNSFPNHHCVSTASETTTSINVSTPNIKKETVPSVELGNSSSASKTATNISSIKIKEEPTSNLHCSASNCSPGSENSVPYSVFNSIKEDSTSEFYNSSTSEFYNSSTYPLTNAVENYYSEVYSEPVIDQNMNNNNNTQNLYIVDGNVMCISSISVQEPTEMITPD